MLQKLTFSSSMTSRTAEAIAQLTGFPPNVLKYSIPVLRKESATAFVVITAAIGCPFPCKKNVNLFYLVITLEI